MWFLFCFAMGFFRFICWDGRPASGADGLETLDISVWWGLLCDCLIICVDLCEFYNENAAGKGGAIIVLIADRWPRHQRATKPTKSETKHP